MSLKKLFSRQNADAVEAVKVVRDTSSLYIYTKVRQLLLREMLFADDAALASHTQEGLQSLVNCLAHTCREFGLTNSLKKTNVMGQFQKHLWN